MYKNLTVTSFIGLVAIILGAFGTHALKDKLSIDAMQSFETAVRYQVYHVLLLFFINSFNGFSERFKNRLSTLLFIGIILFSGSIYTIHLANIPAKSIWFITPLGGVFLIAAWFLLFLYFSEKVLKKD